MRIVLTTFPDERTAHRVGRKLLAARLAACLTTLPARSVYWWKGAMEESSECLALLKTTAKGAPALVRALAAAHPYEVPEIVTLRPEAVSAPYREWLEATVGRTAPTVSPRSRGARAPR